MSLSTSESVFRRFFAAIRNGGASARSGMLIKLMLPISRALDLLLGMFLVSGRKGEDLPPCLMLIGTSRSGSTLIYQVLTRTVPSVFISNWTHLFPRISGKFTQRKTLNSFNGFKSYYGYTAAFSDVNEGNDLIAELFSGSPDSKEIRRRFIRLLSRSGATKERPFIFKNVRFSNHIVELHAAIPELIFLRIQRDPYYQSQSVFKAYHELGYFNPIAKEMQESDITDPLEYGVANQMALGKELRTCLDGVISNRRMDVTYEEFCSDPVSFVQNVCHNLGVEFDTAQTEDLKTMIKASRSDKFDQDVLIALQKWLKKYE